MFSKTIGKKCQKKLGDCRLAGQLQDTGLVICPECGSDLVLEKVEDKRLMAVAMAALALVGASLGMFGYGLLAKGLDPIRTARWVLGQIEVNDSFRPTAAEPWLDGMLTFYDGNGAVAVGSGQFLYEIRDGRRQSTFREALEANSTMKIDLTSIASTVQEMYVVYLADDGGRVLFASDGASAPLRGPVEIPGNGKLIRLDGGTATEHFVLLASRRALPSVRALVEGAAPASDGIPNVMVPSGALESVIAPLESDPDTFILHLFIPHS